MVNVIFLVVECFCTDCILFIFKFRITGEDLFSGS